MRSLAALGVTSLAALALLACTGATGTLQVELAVAPNSPVLDPVARLRVTLTNPRRVVEVTRTSSGFDLAFDVDTSGVPGALIVEGLDASGELVACGQSPAFPVAAINARIVVYMAAPNSIALAPVSLAAPLSEVSSSSIGFGVVLAGGRTASGAPSTALAVYNAYDHTLRDGLPLPGPRAGLASASNTIGGVYLFGGTATDGNPAGTLWLFDSTTAPNGRYVELANEARFARTGQRIVSVGGRYLVTGMPALTIEIGILTARNDVAALSAVAAGATQPNGPPTAIFAGQQLLRFRDGLFDILSGSALPDASATELPGGRAVVIGGLDPTPSRDALVIDGTTGAVTVVPDAIATPRSRPSLAATSRHLIVAGGSDATGAPIASAEVLDAETLAPIATLPILPRSGMFAIALANDQVLLGGGTPALSQLELFNPEPPEL